MDIKKPQQSKKRVLVQRLLIFALAVVLLILFLKALNNSASVARSDLLISKVMQGDLELIIKGSGQLRAKDVRFISAPSKAVVKQVPVKAGEMLEAGQVIAQLENLELAQEVKNAQWRLSQAQASYRKTSVSNKIAMLEVLDALSEAESTLSFMIKEEQATAPLAAKGIVSKIDYEKLKEKLKQQQRSQAFLANKKKILLQAHDELLSIAKDEVTQKMDEYQSIKHRFEQLTIRAQSGGILQSLAIETGQSVSLGQKIALIGDHHELIAIVKVPQNHAQQVGLEDRVKMSNGHESFFGKVTRIAPVVTDNSVEIEIHVIDPLPNSVRHKQGVDANIITGMLANVMYITRPSIARENSELNLYKLSADGNIATLMPFKMGEVVGNQIVISGEIKPGQEVVISDLSHLINKKNEQLIIY